MIALSFSRLSTYEQCPHKFYRQFIDKSYPDDADNIHFVKGQKKHKQLQNYIDCLNDNTMIQHKYDGDVKNALPIVDALHNNGFTLSAERQLAVDENFKPCDWFSKQTMYRAIIDVVGLKKQLAINGDWKTGKYRDYDGSATGQLHLSSLILMMHADHVEVVKSAYWFIESKQSVMRQFDRTMVQELKIPFIKAFEVVNTDKSFDATRNQYCNFCKIKELRECPLDK